MEELEKKNLDGKQAMAVADALDEIQAQNAKDNQRIRNHDGEFSVSRKIPDEERQKQETQDEKAVRRAFATRRALARRTPK